MFIAKAYSELQIHFACFEKLQLANVFSLYIGICIPKVEFASTNLKDTLVINKGMLIYKCN
ncbi:hypothetical protein PPSC2_25905 (plasmid) [Paenibacillus polymyxa SC2]|uniref:Uncharacterized protein n=1 Tax=Paenibacillus polymyxa (strain SC2) TaxID=886882 RepID=E3EKM6_PAEPS|nr:hypothetical protein PPSC2_25905 [Paenibacillus polymyxa SC2]